MADDGLRQTDGTTKKVAKTNQYFKNYFKDLHQRKKKENINFFRVFQNRKTFANRISKPLLAR